MTTEERLTRLERKNRRLTVVLIFAGSAVALLAVLAIAGRSAQPDANTLRES